MNGPVISPQRVVWTTLALNFCLEIYQSIKNLRIGKDEDVSKLPGGTMEDARRIDNFITGKIKDATFRKKYTSFFWFPAHPNDLETFECPSDLLEQAYADIADFYLKHQFMINEDEGEVVIADDDNGFSDDDVLESEVEN